MAPVSVFGLGYVGSVLTACLAESGRDVIGVDTNPLKVAMVLDGRSPVIEEGLNEALRKGVQAGRIRATTDSGEAVRDSEISLVCVGTPSNHNGSPSLTYVTKVVGEIGAALRDRKSYHVVAVRSTILPGTTETVIIPTLEQTSGKKAGHDVGVCFNPEFLREGSSVRDFYDPPFTVIGTDDERAARRLVDLYSILTAPVKVVPFRVAEMIKYANNAFHALKVCFANEVGNICKRQDIDSHQVMDVFCRDKKLNLSPYYLKPGFAFGGSCLPKDLRALLYHSRHMDVNVPLLESLLVSNRNQIDNALQMITQLGLKRVGVLGFSFKAGTDDLRESPVVSLIEQLVGKGYPLKVYDGNVSLAKLQGANRAYIEQEIPHIAHLMAKSIDEVLNWSELIIIGNHSREFETALSKLRGGQRIIDLVRITHESHNMDGQYQGICW